MGCSFDSSAVWSSSEAQPIECPATSFETCGNFITALDHLYEARNKTIFPDANPMRKNKDQVAMEDFGEGNPHFDNVVFPTNYVWKLDERGVASIELSYRYEYDSVLSSNPGDHFCDAGLGPPSVLMGACDATMSFLLGNTVSTGLVWSTSKAVNGKWENIMYIICSLHLINFIHRL